jgi:cytochrome c biogenesis protein CcdA
VAPLSLFLQGTFSNFLGPVLIVTGMILSRLLDLNRYYKNISLTDKLWLINGAFLPSMLLGSILALSFCPSTASIFFGIMLPLAVKNRSTVVFPLMYAAGVLLPLIVLSILIRKGLSGILPEFWIKKLPQIMGWIIIGIGVYITLKELYF